MDAPLKKDILFCRLPGLLALAARRTRPDENASCPLIVSEGRLVRDACPLALTHGVRIGATVVQARRLCPIVMYVPLGSVDARHEQTAFLDVLADLSPVVEPDGHDAAYVDLTGWMVAIDDARAGVEAALGLTPVVGLGVSCLAARACAESGVERLTDASVEWLWPDDPAVMGRLQRLGLTTFGAVADVGEEALRLHFGRIAPVLHRRAQGQDLTPVRALYPPPRADVIMDCGDAPVDDRERLRLVIIQASRWAEIQLGGLGVGRRLVLEVRTEQGETRLEWAVPAPMERAADIQRAAWRLLAQTRLTAPVTRLRLRVEDVSLPTAHTADLFGAQSGSVTLEAARRRLAARFGLTTLTILGQWPRTPREKRRAAVRDRDDAFGRATA